MGSKAPKIEAPGLLASPGEGKPPRVDAPPTKVVLHGQSPGSRGIRKRRAALFGHLLSLSLSP